MKINRFLKTDKSVPQNLILSVTVGISATLLFWIQPLFSKMVLPRLGGTSSVWNTCLFFYQAVLFFGYLYAFLLHRNLSLTGQTRLHRILLLISILFLPVIIPEDWRVLTIENPIPELLLLLFYVLGLPFFLLSATAPLLQQWLSRTDHPDARDPYFLYSASNMGSLGILFLFPFLLEPFLSISTQSRLWAAGYVLFIAFLWIATSILRNRKPVEQQEADYSTLQIIPDSTPAQRLHWLILSLVPCSYLYGVTQYISTEIAVVPIFWILPLALYLLTFVLVFARRTFLPHRLMLRMQPFLILPVVLSFIWNPAELFWLVYPLHLLAFFVTAMVCHGELVRRRPHPQHLSEFYLWLSLGGVLGGACNALIAPSLFNMLWEYPLIIIAACCLRPLLQQENPLRERMYDLLYPAIIALLLPGVVFYLEHSGGSTGDLLARAVVLGVCGLALLFRKRPLRFGFTIGVLVILGILHLSGERNMIYQERSFYGMHRVETENEGMYHLLIHGSTTHGVQNRQPGMEGEPLAYFSRRGPLGELMQELYPAEQRKRMAVVGLGAGAISCYAHAGDVIHFYEIDPVVCEIASNPELFSYLRHCPAELAIIPGDARISLYQQETEAYDVIIQDAFSSDAIPVHLLTMEAMQTYLSRLKPEGILLFNITNRYVDMKPVLAALARHLNLAGLHKSDTALVSELYARKIFPSEWIVLSPDEEKIQVLQTKYGWDTLSAHPDAPVWTDDYSNILSCIKLGSNLSDYSAAAGGSAAGGSVNRHSATP